MSQPELLPYLDRVAREIDSLIYRHFVQNVGTLNAAAAHLLSAGGKRLRPALVVLAADAVCAGSSERIFPAALALEVTHTFTLIHDDIMDGDQFRRGVPTVHTQWDMPTGILAGDVLYARAFDLICRSLAPDEAKVRAVSLLANTCAELCQGQHQDMMFQARTDDLDEWEYVEMAQKKTGVLYAASAAIGGILAGGSAQQIHDLYQFGLNIGVAFQIQDDLIDLIAPQKMSGKDRASDLREGKQTLIRIKAMKKGLDLSKYRTLLSECDIEMAISELSKAGIIDEVRAAAEEHVTLSLKHLSCLPDSKERRLLMDLATYFITRRY